jgi:hypothetical protein
MNASVAIALHAVMVFLLSGLSGISLLETVAFPLQPPLLTVSPSVEFAQAGDAASETHPPQATTDNPSGNTVPVLSTYHLTILPHALQQITFSVPILKALVFLEMGNDMVRCGDNYQTYACLVGRPLTVKRNIEQAMDRFWAQNDSNEQMRLRIEVYDDVEQQNTTSSHESTG